jgi:hypothetical protein
LVLPEKSARPWCGDELDDTAAEDEFPPPGRRPFLLETIGRI